MKRKIAIVVVEFLKNIANGFLFYIFCTFMMVGMFYINYLSGNMPVSVYSEVKIHDLFWNIGYMFLIIKLMVSIFESAICFRWRQTFLEAAAVTVVLAVMYAVPELTHWICIAGIDGNFWCIVGLFAVNIILKYILRFLEKDRGVRAIAVLHRSFAKRNE